MRVQELCHYAEQFTKPLRLLYENTGNSFISGFLGEELNNVMFDEEGRVHFETHKEFEEESIDSVGVVLKNSILIKQTQKSHDFVSYRLYSWDVFQNQYTFIAFDQPMVMNRFYDSVAKFQFNLCQKDIIMLFQQMGLTLENVIQILVNQKNIYSPIPFEEEGKGNSYI